MGNWTYQYDVLNRLLSGSASSGPDASKNACWSYNRGPRGQVFVRGVEDRGPRGQVFVRGVENDFGNRTIESVQTGACSTAGSVASTLVFMPGSPRTGLRPWWWMPRTSSPVSSRPAEAASRPPRSSTTRPATSPAIPTPATSTCMTPKAASAPSRPRMASAATIMMGYLYDADGSPRGQGNHHHHDCDPATNGFAMTGNNTGTYVLGQGGEELTQLSGSGAWQRTNVFGGGKQLATYDSMGLHFQIEDALGTRRMQTNADGQPETDIQSLPYGDALLTATDQYAPATADEPPRSTSPAKNEIPNQATTTSGLGTTAAAWADSCRPIGALKLSRCHMPSWTIRKASISMCTRGTIH